MYAHAEKSKNENLSKAIAKTNIQKKSDGKQNHEFVDNRTGTKSQKSLQKMINQSAKINYEINFQAETGKMDGYSNVVQMIFGLGPQHFASQGEFQKKEKIRISGLRSVFDRMRGENKEALETCLYYFTQSLEPLISEKLPEMREAAKWSFDEEEENYQQKVENEARKYAKYEIEKIPREVPPSCGDTAKRIRTLLLDEVFSLI